MKDKLNTLRLREEELRKYPDYEKRLGLFRSWLGQADKCQRKSKLQDPYYEALGLQWLAKCEKLLEGVPVEEVKGKVRVVGKKPMSKKQRLAWKAEHKQEIRTFRRQVQRENEERQKAGLKNN